MLGEGLVARLLRFSAELMAVDPDRIGLAVFSRLVEALRGMPKPPDCFSSWLRLCLWPGKCSLWPPMEGLCKRLLLCSVCGAWLCASCQNVSNRYHQQWQSSDSYLWILEYPWRDFAAWPRRWTSWSRAAGARRSAFSQHSIVHGVVPVSWTSGLESWYAIL